MPKRTRTELLAEERTELAAKRTELAHERTFLAYMRTATTLILFGMAFLGFSRNYDWLFYAGWASIISGVGFLIIAVVRSQKHSNEIGRVTRFIKRIILFGKR